MITWKRSIIERIANVDAMGSTPTVTAISIIGQLLPIFLWRPRLDPCRLVGVEQVLDVVQRASTASYVGYSADAAFGEIAYLVRGHLRVSLSQENPKADRRRLRCVYSRRLVAEPCGAFLA